MSASEPSRSYIILGSGIFGASTALHLIQSNPQAQVTLIDRDSYLAERRVAASWDWNKVIRSDYSSPFYTKLALEAQDLWRESPLFQSFYHESGAVWISPSNFSDLAIKNFSQTGDENAIARAQTYSVEEAKQLYGGLFADADYTNVRQVLVNERSGWAEAKEALQATIAEAVRLGVDYVTAEISSLVLEKGRDVNKLRCAGVKAATGEVFSADRVVLCAGAYTPKLLMDSAPHDPEVHAGERILAAGVTEGVELLREGHDMNLDKMPVGINDSTLKGPGVADGLDLREYMYGIGVLPLPKLNALKYWGQIIFRNTVRHDLAGISVSMPPPGPDYAQWDVPSILQRDVCSAPGLMFGLDSQTVLGQNLKDVRICWEATTPDEDFIISSHSSCDDLFIATCGSFHGFKFLPVIGKYVVQMLHGELDPERRRRWAWDREMPEARTVKNKSPPTELRDLLLRVPSLLTSF